MQRCGNIKADKSQSLASLFAQKLNFNPRPVGDGDDAGDGDGDGDEDEGGTSIFLSWTYMANKPVEYPRHMAASSLPNTAKE